VLNTADEMLWQDNHVYHGYMGITGYASDTTIHTTPRAMTPQGTTVGTTDTTHGTRDHRGVDISWVSPSGAAFGLLHPGEIIEAVNGTPVASMAEVRSMLYSEIPGAIVTLAIKGDGQTSTIDITLGSNS
jgi:S1-C subfamily serine protease